MTEVHCLNPHARVTRYGGTCWRYDARLIESPLVEVPTTEIGEDELRAAELIKDRGFLLEPRTLEDVGAYLRDKGLDPRLAASLTDLRILEPHRTHAQAVERRVLDHFNRRYLPGAEDEVESDLAEPPYRERADYSLAPNTFFNLPRAVPRDKSHVGLLGVPVASLSASLGTVTGPASLRLKSRALCWLDVHKQGVYTEIALDAGCPDVLGRGVVLRDGGDLDAEGLTPAELSELLSGTLVDEFLAHDVRPLVIGGDHAITAPIVRAHLERTSDLGVLHLDAHNDLFYTPRVVYSHAAPISNLLRTTAIERVASFGLRTFADKRMAGLRSIYQHERAAERVCLRSVTETKRLIMDARLLDRELDALSGRPYHLTLDLDVLSDSATGGRVSTPFGAGLEWHELLSFLDAAFRRLDIVSCDVVEYNEAGGDGRAPAYPLTALLLLVVDRLARSSPKHSPAVTARADGRRPQLVRGVAVAPR